ncbi:MAG: methyltransferase domain-containing protein [Acidilobus sp.]|jgi:hypothetical protein|nr:methyltransferase domain-containing protein [Acidilobus sp.]
MALQVFGFSACECVVLAPWESEALLNASPGSVVTVNAGKDSVRVAKRSHEVIVELGGRAYSVEVEVLRRHAHRRSYLAVEWSAVYEIEVRTPFAYYKLVPVEGSCAPTLEINGIHMHRVEGTTPIEDARSKVRALPIRPGSEVLEVGTGLGYTTAAALEAGAAHVTSIEVDENVLWIAERNPWSRHLASDKVTILLGDAVMAVKELSGPFDYVVHDPPRFTSSTGPLYGREFYAELFRLLRPGGRLFHYTGEPGRARGRSLWADVARRLREVGFDEIRYVKEALGVVARRPKRP